MIYAVTGHRPDKLGGYRYDVDTKLFRFAVRVLREIQPELVYSGMALGWDQAMGYACHELHIPYVACLPYKNYGENWPQKSQNALKNLLSSASDVFTVSPSEYYQPWLMQARNEYMVDKAEAVIALWNGSSGGTHNCVKYATKVNKPIVNFWEQWLNFELG